MPQVTCGYVSFVSSCRFLVDEESSKLHEAHSDRAASWK